MKAVVPWPGTPADPGYVNLHYSMVNPKPTPGKELLKGMGWPFRSLDGFVQRAAWIEQTSHFKDVWFCTSLQREMGINTKGKPKAKRFATYALALKALWIDLDVGAGDPKKYDTIQQAAGALFDFQKKAGLPKPSAMVNSGNGLHAYWISDVPLDRETWAQYADGLRAKITETGLKCDAGLTTDAARLLRVPGTFNHKTVPPKPVQLLNVPLVTYNFATDLLFLQSIVPQRNTVNIDHEVFIDKAAFGGGGPSAAFAALKPDGSLQGGVNTDERLLKGAPIFKQCDFLGHALKTEGADYDNPLWNLSLLCASFMENGNAVAHAISKGHPKYTPDDTQTQFDRKMAERVDRNLGYPSCATIAANGCKSCATCPLFAKGKSPLNIRPVVTATVSGLNMAPPIVGQTQAAKDMFLPEGYDVNAKGFICEIEQKESADGELGPPKEYQLFWSRITDPWVQAKPDCLNFTTTIDLDNVRQASIRQEEMSAQNLSYLLGNRGVKTFPRNKARLEHFLVSWLAKLHSVAAATQSLPFGWYKNSTGAREGFVYAGKVMKDDGTESPCGIGDSEIRSIFHPNGDINDWFKACTTITQQKRPELDAIIALSFASPLIPLSGKNNATLCAYGESGVGKTAAFSVGISVWGHATKGKAVSNSTLNGVMRKMGELSALPMYWDEIKNPKAQASVYDYLYNASDGVEKDRMIDGQRMQARGTWQNAMMMAANISFVDYIMKMDPTHVAGVSRVLEYNVVKTDKNSIGKISATEASVVIDQLTTSYGQMGLRYAKLLAMNHVAIAKEVMDTCQLVETDMQNTEAERIWVALVGCLLVGARLANTLGADLDVDALKTFLYRVYRENRMRRDTMMSVGGGKDTIEGIMSAYFSQVQTNEQAIWTDGMPGKGAPGIIKMRHGPRNERNVAVTTAVAVRWDTKGQTLYINRAHFMDYLAEKGVGASTTFAGLQREYGMKVEPKITIAGGTMFNAGRITCLVIRGIGPQHDWWDILHTHTPPDERPTPTNPAPTVVTGFGV
ncbi:MAG TPA: DUF927 domain-containing protein [Acidobacteriaceae bacterium]